MLILSDKIIIFSGVYIYILHMNMNFKIQDAQLIVSPITAYSSLSLVPKDPVVTKPEWIPSLAD